MTNMDEQIAKHCKAMILRATRKVAEERRQPCQVEDTLKRAVSVLKEQPSPFYESVLPDAALNLPRIGSTKG